MIRIVLLGLIFIGIACGQRPIMSCDDARSALASIPMCNTTWTNVRAALVTDNMDISNADANTLCDDVCVSTVLQVIYRCADEVGVSCV